jgi:hypothetical protein
MKRVALVFCMAATAAGLLAQNPGDPLPEPGDSVQVNVFARDAEAAEQNPLLDMPSNPGLFVVTRQGHTNIPIRVYYRLFGSASNGVDYRRLPDSIEIPAGALSAEIEVDVIDDALVEGTEQVALRIEWPACAAIFPRPPGCYSIGPYPGAVVRIQDNDSAPGTNNLPPMVRITAPTNGAVFKAPATIHIEATTVDPDGYAPFAEFYAGTNKIGEVRIDFIQAPPDGEPIHFGFEWQNVPAGRYALTARAIDDEGAAGRSDPVFIAVVDFEPPGTVVSIVARDAEAAEQDPRLDSLPNNGLFAVERHGPTNFPLQVYYSIGGTAQNGIDYERLSGQVVIPEGARSASIEVIAIDDRIAEGDERVVLTLRPPACIAIYPPPPECYSVGSASRAVVVIHDDDIPDNQAPTATITFPSEGATFAAWANIRIDVTTADPDGYAPRAMFFANDVKLGERGVFFIDAPPDGTPLDFSFEWQNVAPGEYALTASTMDQEGATGVSPPVRIRVGDSNAPPSLPSVTIAAPDAYASEGGWNWIVSSPLTATDTNSNGEVWWITDWRTNVATFVVRRSGETNEDLTVFYSTEGMAINGVDYARLSGHVTILAGRHSARIAIWPLDDMLLEGPESIVLRLQPGPTMQPLYTVGRPNVAGVVLADNDGERPRCLRLADGLFHVCLPALSGAYYSIEGSPDLDNWSKLGTRQVLDGAMHYVDTEAPGIQTRFYRLVPEPISAVVEE